MIHSKQFLTGGDSGLVGLFWRRNSKFKGASRGVIIILIFSLTRGLIFLLRRIEKGGAVIVIM